MQKKQAMQFQSSYVIMDMKQLWDNPNITLLSGTVVMYENMSNLSLL